MKGAQVITKFFDDHKISHLFGVSGANIEELFECVYREKKIEIILAKSEYSAAAMAMGSYLATKKPAFVLTTSGPGILNTIPILAEAYTSQLPLVVISGQVPIQLEGMGAFQDTSGKGESLNIQKMLDECTCYQQKVESGSELIGILKVAYQKASISKKPAVVLIPKNIFSEEIIYSLFDQSLNSSIVEEIVNLPLAQNFCQSLDKYNKTPPLIVIGEECVHLYSQEIINEFVYKSGGAVALTPNTKGLFDNFSPRYLGLIGIMGHDEVSEFLEKTENVVLIGVKFNLLNRIGFSSALFSKNVLFINEKKEECLFDLSGINPSYTYGNINNILKNLNTQFVESINPVLDINSIKLNPEIYCWKNIINEIQDKLDPAGNVFIDAGNSGAFVIHHLKTRGNGNCYVSLGMGGMGNSIGTAIGSAVASKEKSYIFLGDGSFLIYGLEVHTAMEYNLPIVFFVMNNNSHGMCTTREKIFLNGTTGINDFKNSFYAQGIEKMFPGIITYEVDDLSKLKHCLHLLADKNTPSLVSLTISNSECPPFRSFIKN